MKLGTGPMVNLDEVYRYLAGQPGTQRIVVASARTEGSPDHARLFVLVERADCSQISCQSGPSPEVDEILRAGCGTPDKKYARYVSLVHLPVGLLPETKGDPKPRMFVNFDSFRLPPGHDELAELIAGATGEKVLPPDVPHP
ncbi:MAG: hypothetical protein K6T75_11515 [Acetobacteraceae bacterium]|nr:hypothetical protein [Acetobacteraceae bacterium]